MSLIMVLGPSIVIDHAPKDGFTYGTPETVVMVGCPLDVRNQTVQIAGVTDAFAIGKRWRINWPQIRISTVIEPVFLLGQSAILTISELHGVNCNMPRGDSEIWLLAEGKGTRVTRGKQWRITPECGR